MCRKKRGSGICGGQPLESFQTMKNHLLTAWLCLTGSALFAQEVARLDLGQLQTGGTVSFVRNANGGWGIEIEGGAAPRISQPKPVRLEIFRSAQDIWQFAVGYR